MLAIAPHETTLKAELIDIYCIREHIGPPFHRLAFSFRPDSLLARSRLPTGGHHIPCPIATIHLNHKLLPDHDIMTDNAPTKCVGPDFKDQDQKPSATVSTEVGIANVQVLPQTPQLIALLSYVQTQAPRYSPHVL